MNIPTHKKNLNFENIEIGNENLLKFIMSNNISPINIYNDKAVFITTQELKELIEKFNREVGNE